MKFEPGDRAYASALGVEKGRLKEYVEYEIISIGIDPNYVKALEFNKKTATYYPAAYFVKKGENLNGTAKPL